jgi:hypothetical protein
MAGCGSIKRAADMQTELIQHVRVKRGRGEVLVSEQLLHGSNVLSVFQHIGRKACLKVCKVFRKGDDIAFRLRAGQPMVLPPGTHIARSNPFRRLDICVSARMANKLYRRRRRDPADGVP